MPMSSSPTSVFPSFLLPSLSFRRRSSTSTTTSYFSDQSTSTGTSPSLISPFSPSSPTDTYLSGSRSLLRCAKCLTHIAHTSQIVSKGFTGRHGRAYLVGPPESILPTSTPDASHPRQLGNLLNTHSHKPSPRQLVTGAHTVADVSCTTCGTTIGWKYVEAEEESQKYKVGKFILETKKVLRGVCWENDVDEGVEEGGGVIEAKGADDEVEFDSGDEDECEDLFAGMWTPGLAKIRRRRKAWKTMRV